jgi:hypothetical protein
MLFVPMKMQSREFGGIKNAITLIPSDAPDPSFFRVFLD